MFDSSLSCVNLLLSMLRCRHPQVIERLFNSLTSHFSSTPLVDVLVDLLLIESEGFLHDLELTDSVIAASSKSNGILDETDKKTDNAQDKYVDVENAVPVAEIVLAAHIALLLYEIAVSAPCSTVSDTDIEDASTLATGDMSVQRLPRGNWWVPARLLKAFLALQHRVCIPTHFIGCYVP